jgi:bifunctional NMN adenylyltransferase/nudix hydrolase
MREVHAVYKPASLGVIIGRFQVPQLHEGHIKLISKALVDCTTIMFLLGCTTVRDERNPYDIEHRKKVISKIFGGYCVELLWDNPSDYVWSDQLDMLIANYAHYRGYAKNIYLYHSRDSFKDHYKGSHPLIEVEEVPGVSGTKLRSQ